VQGIARDIGNDRRGRAAGIDGDESDLHASVAGLPQIPDHAQVAEGQGGEFGIGHDPGHGQQRGAGLGRGRVGDERRILGQVGSLVPARHARAVSKAGHAPLPVHVYGNVPPAQMQHLDLTKHLVSSGGYMLKEWKADDHITMVSNHNWWHGRPYIDQIYFKEYLSDTATEVALENGDIDMALQLGTPEWLALKNDPKFILIHNPADVWDWWVPNLTTPILSDLHVRQAMMYGYDRVTEAQKLFHGEDVPAYSPIPWAQKWAFDPATENVFPYDPAKANQILDAAGWTMGPDGYRHKNGQTLAFTTGLISGSDVAVKDFELWQANLKAVGVKTDAKQLEFNVYFDQEQKGNFDVDGGGFGATDESGPAILGASGKISGSSLEGSNTDIADEF